MVTCKNQLLTVELLYFYAKNSMLTKDLGILENSFDYLEDLPKGDVWCVEFDDSEKVEDFYFRSEKNAKNKFDELAKKHDLEVVKNSGWGRNSRGKSIWMGKITFED